MLSEEKLLKVFLAEDEVIVREALRDSIPWEQHGFVFVGEASDGEMALEMVRELKPDIVITDIKMPFMNGLTFSRYVSEELPETKIIIISGYDDFEYARQAVELHVDRFLLKPVTKADMISALENTRRRIETERAKTAAVKQAAPDAPETLELSGFDPLAGRKIRMLSLSVLLTVCMGRSSRFSSKTICWSVSGFVLRMRFRMRVLQERSLQSWFLIFRWIVQ